MLVVRNCFVAKPGCAGKLASQLKEAAAGQFAHYRVLTDLTGDFNRVILEYEVAGVGEFEASLKNYASNQAFREKMKGYTDLWLTGSRELLQVA